MIQDYKEKMQKIIEMETNHVLDFSDLKNVSGFADNIFIAEILKNNGEEEIDSYFPETKFEVNILYNIKGKLSGKKHIIQDGGKTKSGVYYVSEGTELFKQGGVYLITTRGDKLRVMSNKNGNKFLNSKNLKKFYNFSEKERILNSKILENYRNAYKNENNYNSKNQYKNLTKQEKENFENILNGFLKEDL